MSSLADRIRTVVAPRNTGDLRPRDADPIGEPARALDLSPLGGAWQRDCFVVERALDAYANHGRGQVGALASQLREAADEAGHFAGGAPARPPFVFLDLETTGLSGGAGTQAFLVGCAWFDDDRFVTKQFLMTRYADERPMLEAVASECARAGALVTFNGKSFDAPVLETRYLFHRLEWFGADVPHVDVLHPARQFWKRDECSLVSLEQRLVGHRRRGDVPGFEIPARYFKFVRSGEAAPLGGVLEHNRLDLLSLAALTARLLHLFRLGPDAAHDAREALALGHRYMRAGFEDRARDAYERSIAMSRAPRGAFDGAKIDALRALALAWRRAKDHESASRCWHTLLEIRGCPPAIAREATEALAIHHEHRVHDLVSARSFALRTLENRGDEQWAGARNWAQAVQHRLARLERKLSTARQPGLPSLPLQPSCAAPTSEPRISS